MDEISCASPAICKFASGEVWLTIIASWKELLFSLVRRRRAIVLMFVQEPGDLSSQLRRGQQLTHRSGRVKELPLKFGGNRVPLHDDRSAEASKNMLLFRGESGVNGSLLVQRLK